MHSYNPQLDLEMNRLLFGVSCCCNSIISETYVCKRTRKKTQTRNVTTPRIWSNSMLGINFVCILLVARRVFSSSFVLNFNWWRDFVELSVAHAFLIPLPCSSIYSARQHIMAKCAVHTHTHTHTQQKVFELLIAKQVWHVFYIVCFHRITFHKCI